MSSHVDRYRSISIHRALFFQQQYSPMVMRKFRKSLDNSDSAAAIAAAAAGAAGGSEENVNSPRLTRKTRGGSLSAVALSAADPSSTLAADSPSVRRRRSRIPSEEDDQLINFLVAGGQHDGSRERNLSVGNLCKSAYLN